MSLNSVMLRFNKLIMGNVKTSTTLGRLLLSSRMQGHVQQQLQCLYRDISSRHLSSYCLKRYRCSNGDLRASIVVQWGSQGVVCFHSAMGTSLSNSQPGQENKQVHLISQDGKSLGIVPLKEAQVQAEANKVHLFLLRPSTHKSPHAVYKLMDKKTMYELEKQKKEKHSNMMKNTQKTKELSFNTDIAGQDLHWKVQKLENLLMENYKVIMTINQRRMSKSDKKEFFNNIIDHIKDFGVIEGNIVETEQRMKCMLKPVKLTKNK